MPCLYGIDFFSCDCPTIIAMKFLPQTMKTPPTLETERLILRPFTLADSDFIMELLNTEGYLQYIADRNIKSREDAERYLESGPLRSYAEHGFGLCKILLKARNGEADAGEAVGMCGLLWHDYLPNPDVGYALLPQHEGKGYARESAETFLRWGFEECGISTILAIVLPQNYGSVRLLEQLGMKLEKTITKPETGDELLLYSISAAM